MTNVHVNIDSVKYFTDKLTFRAKSIGDCKDRLMQVTVTLAESWGDEQYNLFYDDSRRLMSLLDECVRHCEYEKRRLENIIAAAENIKYQG
jgi:hypothetical protein